MAAQTSDDVLCNLFIAILGEGDDANLAVSTVRQTRSLQKTISALSKEKLKHLKNDSTQSALRTMEAVVEITDGNIELLSTIGADFRQKSLSGIALAYLDPTPPGRKRITGLDYVKWERELFRLEPTAVIASLVTSGDIPVAPQQVKMETERLLRAAVQQKVDLSSQPLRRLQETMQATVTPTHQPMPPSTISFLESLPAPAPAEVLQAAVERIQTIQRLQAVVVNPRHIGALMTAGFESAKSISMIDAAALVERVQGQISQADAVHIHDNAFTITTRNEQTWAEILKIKSGNLFPATRAKQAGNNEEDKDKDAINFSTLFGSFDDLGNEGAESVLSPAAYLVDLLETLRNYIVSPTTGVSLLSKLEERRSDLRWLQLTAENTYNTLPYLDLANEVMEHYIAKNSGKELGEGYPKAIEDLCANVENADASLVEPANIVMDIYSQLIQPTVWPLHQFPYNYGIDFVNTALNVLGINPQDLYIDFMSTRRHLLETIPAGVAQQWGPDMLIAAEESLQRIRSAQLLGLEEEDYTCITRELFMPASLFREFLPGNRTMDDVAYRAAIGYNGCAKYWGYDSADGMLDMSKDGLTFIRDELLKRSGISYDALVEVLQTSFMRARAIITSHDGFSAIAQDLGTLRLRASVSVNADGALNEEICHDLQSFLRLRHRLGWDTRTLDAALYALSQSKPGSLLGIDPEMVQGLADIKQLSHLSGIPVSELCPLFGNLDRNGPQSLYARLCRRSRLRPVDDAFMLNKKDGAVAMSNNLSGVMSALEISAADLQLVLKACGLEISSPLSLESFSSVYRTNKLATLFEMDMKQYASLVALYGFDTRSALPSPSYVLASLKQWKSLQEDGLTTELILNLLGLDEEVETSKEPRQLMNTLLTGLQSVLTQWPEVETGSICTEVEVAAAAAAIDRDRSTEVVNYVEGKRAVSVTVENSRITVHRIPVHLRDYFTLLRNTEKTFISLQGLPDKDVVSMMTALEHDTTKHKGWELLIQNLVSEGQKMSSDIVTLVADTAIQTELKSSDRDSRRNAFIKAARRHIRKQQLQALVVNTVQQAAPGLDMAAVQSLLSEGANKTALDHVVDTITQFASKKDPLGTLTDANFEAHIGVLLRNVRRIEGILIHFGITLRELRLFDPSAGLKKVADLSLMETLAAYKELRHPLSPTQRDALISLIESESGAPANGTNSSTEIEKIASALGWPDVRLAKIFAAKYPRSYDVEAKATACSPIRLLQLQRILTLCNKLHLVDSQIDSVFGWANDIGKADKAFSFAAALRQTLGARNTGVGAVKGYASGLGLGSLNGMGQLKERRRTALTNYLLKDESLQALNINSANDLYDYFLIDVKMGAEMQTSRVRQAISTIQLFVQRCLLGIEDKYGVSAADVKKLKPRWDTIGRFTLWEANRRVFLYPENWIDPTLRDNKTEPFKALEAAILQGDLTEESISRAIKSYVYAIQPITHLDVQAYLWDKGDNDRARFHFFARTRTEPYQYFYRKLELQPVGTIELLPYWHPWTSLDLGAPPQAVDKTGEAQQSPGSYLVPALVRGRLMLFVPEISLRSKTPEKFGANKTIRDMVDATLDEAQLTTSYWEIKMAWTELRDGQWSPRTASPDSLTIHKKDADPLPNISAFRFRTRARSAQNTKTSQMAKFDEGVEEVLVIDVESWHKVNEGKENIIVPRYHGQFEMRGAQLYRSETLEAVFNEALVPTTLPTRFSKLNWTMKDREALKVPEQRLPSYTFEYRKPALGTQDGEKETKKSSMQQPLLIDTKEDKDEKRDLSWTLTFDDTQTSQPVGLLVDVKKASTGAQTYFARPRTEKLTEGGTKILASAHEFPFHHTFSNPLLEAAVTDSSVDKIYEVVSSQTDDPFAFGLYAGWIYHELFDAYSVYNWELGVHAISLLMERLLARQQFDLALRVAHLLFDPTKNLAKPSECWSFPPFRDTKAAKGQSIRSLLNALARSETKLSYTDLTVAEWKRNPFNAHSIARGRPTAYMLRVAQKYVEILVAAGDAHFRQASTESIPMAIQRYIEAAHILGPRPAKVKSLGKRRPQTFQGLMSKPSLGIDKFSNAAIDMELEFPYSCLQQGMVSVEAAESNKKGLLGFLATTYFCVPTNPQVTALWDLVDDRLGKLRACQDINGMALRMPLFDPPIDPGMLVNAAAAGDANAGIAVAVSELDCPLPNYRFTYLMGKAVEMANQLSSLTEMFLSAKEKRDTEALAQLKNQQELIMQGLYSEQKLLQKEEAEKSISALEDLRKSHESRLTYYLRLIGEDPHTGIPGKDATWTDIEQAITKPDKNDDLRMSREEKLELSKSEEAASLSFAASVMDTTASALLALPNLMTQTQPMGVGASLKLDAENVAKCMEGMSTVMKLKAQMREMEGSRASRRNGLIKQLQERRAQANMAGREIKQVDKQIETSLVRVRTAEADIKAHKETVAQAEATEAWYRSKYTNEALYAWMENTTRALCFDAYGLTMDLARKAEKAFQFERGPGGIGSSSRKTQFISSKGYWNNGHDGLLGAQSLLLDLRRMEAAHMESSPSDFEIVKNVSLRQVSPLALVNLRMHGVAVFSLPESLFDIDFPGHYFRRIASVAVTIPCVTGPYTSLNTTLSLLEHSYRISPLAAKGEYARRENGSDDRFHTDRVPVSSVALSQGSSDSGVFELDFGGERYLPFENAGVISTWKLELPQHVRKFNYESISDVVLHIKYRARQGGANLRAAAIHNVEGLMAAADGVSEADGLFALFDVANDFSTAWSLAQAQAQAQAAQKGTSQDIVIHLGDVGGMLPYWVAGYAVKVKSAMLVSRCSPQDAATFGADLLWNTGSGNEKSFVDNTTSSDDAWNVREIVEMDAALSDWRLRFKSQSQGGGSNFAAVENMYLLVRYTAKTQKTTRK